MSCSKDSRGPEGLEGRALQATESSTHNTRRASCVICASVPAAYLASKPCLQPWRTKKRNFFHPPAASVGERGVEILTRYKRFQRSTTDDYINDNLILMASAISLRGRERVDLFSEI